MAKVPQLHIGESAVVTAAPSWNSKPHTAASLAALSL